MPLQLCQKTSVDSKPDSKPIFQATGYFVIGVGNGNIWGHPKPRQGGFAPWTPKPYSLSCFCTRAQSQNRLGNGKNLGTPQAPPGRLRPLDPQALLPLLFLHSCTIPTISQLIEQILLQYEPITCKQFEADYAVDNFVATLYEIVGEV